MAGQAARPQVRGMPGGMTGPMGMRAGAGAGGGSAQMQTRLPPSLQAKMDKVGYPGFISNNSLRLSVVALLRPVPIHPVQHLKLLRWEHC